MTMFGQLARVHEAQRRARAARTAVAVPAAALLARGERHMVPVLGVALGAGFVLGRMRVPPLRIPGLGSLLGGVVAEVAALGAGFLAQSTAENA
jgi:hypothetical protein